MSNQIKCTGEIISLNSVKGKMYGVLGVLRNSGTQDKIPFTCSECGIYKGDPVELTGQINPFTRFGKKAHGIYVSEIAMATKEHENAFTLDAVLEGVSSVRTTPKGRYICDFVVSNSEHGPTKYFNCIAWGNLANRVSQIPLETCIRLEGRLQSRDYRKEGKTYTVNELCVTNVYDA